MTKHKPDIESVLKKLKDRSDDGVGRLVYTGRALSKSDTNLHMCVSSGVVLIPLSEIESINYVFKGLSEDIVHVTVKNTEHVRHAIKREQLSDTPSASRASDGPTDLSHWDHGTATDELIHDACDATDVFVPPGFFEAR